MNSTTISKPNFSLGGGDRLLFLVSHRQPLASIARSREPSGQDTRPDTSSICRTWMSGDAMCEILQVRADKAPLVDCGLR